MYYLRSHLDRDVAHSAHWQFVGRLYGWLGGGRLSRSREGGEKEEGSQDNRGPRETTGSAWAGCACSSRTGYVQLNGVLQVTFGFGRKCLTLFVAAEGRVGNDAMPT